jgi:hypothetical protein
LLERASSLAERAFLLDALWKDRNIRVSLRDEIKGNLAFGTPSQNVLIPGFIDLSYSWIPHVS